MEFLDSNGLKTLISEIKKYVKEKISSINMSGYVEHTDFKETVGTEAGAWPEFNSTIYITGSDNICNNMSYLDMAVDDLSNEINDVKNNQLNEDDFATINGESLFESNNISIESTSLNVRTIDGRENLTGPIRLAGSDNISYLTENDIYFTLDVDNGYIKGTVKNPSACTCDLTPYAKKEDLTEISEDLTKLKNNKSTDQYNILTNSQDFSNILIVDAENNNITYWKDDGELYNELPINYIASTGQNNLYLKFKLNESSLTYNGLYELSFYVKYNSTGQKPSISQCYIDSDSVFYDFNFDDITDSTEWQFVKAVININPEEFAGFENYITINISNIDEVSLYFTPWMLKNISTDYWMNSSSIQNQLGVNSLAINEQKEITDKINEVTVKLVKLSLDVSTGAGTLSTSELANLNNTEYSNIFVEVDGKYSPTLAQGVSLTGGDEDYYIFKSYSLVNKSSNMINFTVQGCLIDITGAFPGIYAYVISINIETGEWSAINGGVKLF